MIYDRSMTTLSRIASVVLLIVIIFVTLSPIGLRPETGHPGMERAAAYLLFGLCIGLGFSKWVQYAVVFVIGLAGVLELLQLVDPGRHGRLGDMLIKAVAGTVGVSLSWLLVRQYRRWKPE